MIGEVDIRVQYEQTQDLVLTIVAGDRLSLLGRNWLQHLTLNWREMKAVSQHAVGSLEYLLNKYGDLYVEELGTTKSLSAKLMSTLKISPSFTGCVLSPMPLRVQLMMN